MPHAIPFPTTDWTEVNGAGEDRAPRRPALGELLQRYLPALRSYLSMKWRLPADRADDLLQGFVTKKILEADLVSRADPLRGKFRHFLMTALDNFIVSELRRDMSRKHNPGALTPLETLGDAGVSAEVAPGCDVFDRAWANQVVTVALGRMRQYCEAAKRPHLWDLFDQRVVGPARHGQPKPSYAKLLDRHGFSSPEQAANFLITAKRIFRRKLEEAVAEYSRDRHDLQEELEYLRRFLRRPEA